MGYPQRSRHACGISDPRWLLAGILGGNSGDTFTPNPAWAHPASNPVEMQKFEAEGETAYLAHKHTIAVSFVRHHPLLFAGVSLRRAVRFWTGFWSFRPSYCNPNRWIYLMFSFALASHFSCFGECGVGGKKIEPMQALF
jgi:hypothetical protein